jgi:hypothetical protein
MYKLHKDNFGQIVVVIRDNGDGSMTSIPMSEDNTDYQAYLLWCEEGNTPEPADQGEQS